MYSLIRRYFSIGVLVLAALATISCRQRVLYQGGTNTTTTGTSFLDTSVPPLTTSTSTYTPISGTTIPTTTCSAVGATYYIGADALVLAQSACKVTASFTIGNFQHYLSLDWVGASGNGFVQRLNMANSCQTKITVRATLLASSQIELVTLGSDGACDISGWSQYILLGRTPVVAQPTTPVTPQVTPSAKGPITAVALDSALGQTGLCSVGWGAQQTVSCLSAATRRDCVQRGYTGGILQELDQVSGLGIESCVQGTPYNVSFAQIQAVLGFEGCSGTTWAPIKTLYCSAGAARLCNAAGFSGGFLQEVDGNNQRAVIECMRGVVRNLPISVLTQNNPQCINNWEDPFVSLGCFSAASRYCVTQGYLGGGAIQEWDGNNSRANVLCW